MKLCSISSRSSSGGMAASSIELSSAMAPSPSCPTRQIVPQPTASASHSCCASSGETRLHSCRITAVRSSADMPSTSSRSSISSGLAGATLVEVQPTAVRVIRCWRPRPSAGPPFSHSRYRVRESDSARRDAVCDSWSATAAKAITQKSEWSDCMVSVSRQAVKALACFTSAAFCCRIVAPATGIGTLPLASV